MVTNHGALASASPANFLRKCPIYIVFPENWYPFERAWMKLSKLYVPCIRNSLDKRQPENCRVQTFLPESLYPARALIYR